MSSSFFYCQPVLLLITVLMHYPMHTVTTPVELGDFVIDADNTDQLREADLDLFDGNNETCVTITAEGITLNLTDHFILTQVTLEGLEVGEIFNLNITGRWDNSLDDTPCDQLVSLNQYQCWPAVYANSIHIVLKEGRSSVDVCEIQLTFFSELPPINSSSLFITTTGEEYNIIYVDNYLLMFPQMKVVTGFGSSFIFANGGVSNTLANSEQVAAMEPYVSYDVNVTRVLALSDSEYLEGSYYSTNISRGAICLSGTCETHLCEANYNDTIYNNGDTFDKYFFADTVCTLQNFEGTSTYQFSSSELVQQHQCVGYCIDLITTLRNSSVADAIICDFLSNSLYCCAEDLCVSPLADPSESQSCLSILENNTEVASSIVSLPACNDDAYNSSNVAPKPILFETIQAETGSLSFYVDETVSGFDFVTLYFYDSSTDSYSNNPYACFPQSGQESFLGGQTHSCELPGLTSNTNYSIALQGHNPDRENDSLRGFTFISDVFSFYQGSTFNLNCEKGGFNVSFYFGDLQSSRNSITFVSTTLKSSDLDEDSSFNEQELVHFSWGNRSVFYIPLEATLLFRGYPSQITVLNNSTNITALFSRYSFSDLFNWNESAAGIIDNSNITFNLTNKRVLSVSGSFSNGVLSSIQFIAKLENGSLETSPCFGEGNCSEFTQNQTNENQFLVGFAGKRNEDGTIPELTLNWATLAISSFYVGWENCSVEAEVNWNDITAFYFHYYVSPPDSCGSRQTVHDENHRIVYENSVMNHQEGGSSRGTFGHGSVVASREMSGGAFLQCIFEGEKILSVDFNTKHEHVKTAIDIDQFEFQLLFYTDASYQQSYSANDVLSVHTGENIFFGVSFSNENDYNMTVYAHTCYAKKDSNPSMADDGSNYLLLEENGCPADDDSFERHASVRSTVGMKMDPLSTRVFHWFDEINAVVFLHCKVKTCTPENEEQCEAPTNCARARRDVNLREGFQKYVSSQPIYLEKTADFVITSSNIAELPYNWTLLCIFCGASMVFLFAILRAFFKQRNAFLYTPLKIN